MVKDYISRLLCETREESKNLEKKIQSLQKDLNQNLRCLDVIKKERNIEENIFSPRNYNIEADKKLETTQRELDRIKEELNYLNVSMENCMQKKREYKKLLGEIDEKEKTENQETHYKKIIELDDLQNTEKTENEEKKQKIEKDEKIEKEENKIKSKNNNIEYIEKSDSNKKNEIQKEILDDLAVAYKKIEYSLALLNGDKNKCKNELRSMLRLIKETAFKIEKIQN